MSSSQVSRRALFAATAAGAASASLPPDGAALANEGPSSYEPT